MNVSGVEWVEITATIVQAVAVTIASVAAVWGLTTWRHEMTARRRAEVAENTLTMFYQARDIISSARFPAGSGGEGSSREKGPNETEDEARTKNSYYIPVERLNRDSEFWGRFEAARYPFMVVFGEDKAAPFDTIRQTRGRVILSAGWLIRTYDRIDDEHNDWSSKRERWESHIWGELSDEDEIAQQIDSAVSQIEAVCKPAITGARK